MKVFISYRRGDVLARSQTTRLKQSLEKDFRFKKVFVDTENTGVSKDFSKKLTSEIEKSDFFLMLIGPDWFDIFERRNADDKPDWVLYELKAAIKSNLDIVPILLDTAEFPELDAVPALESIKSSNALPLNTTSDYNVHLERIVRHLQDDLKGKRADRSWWDKVTGKGPITKQMTLIRKSEDKKPVRVLVVMGENVAYEKALVKAMELRLKEELPDAGFHLVMHEPLDAVFEGRNASPDNPTASEAWARLMERGKRTHKGGQIDYVVTAATFASRAVRDAQLVSALDARGQIYFGVTSPSRAGLTDQDHISGVQYGTGGTEYARTFHELFPLDQRLVFIYNDCDGYEQDRGFAADIAVLNKELAPSLGGRQRFELKALGRVMAPSDLELADPANPISSPVYMAWYDLDNMIADMMKRGDPLIFNRRLWVVPSTYTTENLNQFGIVVGVNDEDGGRQAANIILQHIMTPTRHLNTIKMKHHGYCARMKKSSIVENGIKINPKILSLPVDHKVYRFER